ncbi:MAG: J domain-containing protein [Polyangiaceae bacterium]
MAQDLYATLGVAKTADADAIKKAYRKLAKDLHPDKNPGNAKAEARFKQVNQAFQVLSDPKKRAAYDEFGEEGLREGFDADRVRQARQWQQQGGGGFGGGGFGGGRVRIEDLFGNGVGADQGPFADFFGRGGGRRGPVPGPDLESEIEIDFAQALRGTVLELRPYGRTVTVRIPAGAENGSRLRIAGQGAPSPSGGPPGDLFLVVRVKPHAQYRREGDDLHVDVPVTASEAYFGSKVKVPTLDGAVSLKVPPHTQSGATLRVRGKGASRKGREPGDLYVHFLIQLPKAESPELSELMEKLKTHETEDVRATLAL